jgi:hypothetical protein
MQDAQPTIHVHLKRDGGILVLGSAGANFRWFPVTLDRLQSTLSAAKPQGMVIEYSRDDPETDPPTTVEAIYKIIMSYEMPIKLLREPLLPPP